MDNVLRSSGPSATDSERERRGRVFDRESLRVEIFGDTLSKLGFEGDFNGVFCSSRTMVITDGRRDVLYLLAVLERVESDLLERLDRPISPSSDISVVRAQPVLYLPRGSWHAVLPDGGRGGGKTTREAFTCTVVSITTWSSQSCCGG